MGSLGGFMQRFGAVGSNDPAPEDEGIVEQPGALANFVNRFAGKAESFFFYNGTIEVRFESEDHKYYLVDPELGNLTLLKNSSTVSHIVDRSHALIPWTAKVTVEKMLRLVPTYNAELDPSKPPILVLKHMTLEEFTKLAMEAKSAHSDKLDDAGEVGKIAHNWLEKYILAIMAKDDATVQALLDKKCSDPRSTNCVDAALVWMKAHNVRWLQTERKVYSKKHQCSGTMDGLALTDSCNDPICCKTQFKDHLSLIDWKTSNYLYTEYLFQTACYEAFYMEEFPEEQIDDRWVLRLGKEDAEFDPWYLGPEDFQLDFDGFVACLTLRRIVDQIEERMRERKTYIRKARKAQRVAERELWIAAERAAKAAAKAEAKRLKLEEKERIKREAKAERERIRAEKKAAKLNGKTTAVVTAVTEQREVPALQEESVLAGPAPVLLSKDTNGQEPEAASQERTVHGGDNVQGITGIIAAPDTPDLEGLIAAAKAYKPTPAEEEEQRRSFAYGNVALHNPDVTREMVDKVADAMKPRPSVQYDEEPVVRKFVIPTE
jgi:hypothetical protein